MRCPCNDMGRDDHDATYCTALYEPTVVAQMFLLVVPLLTVHLELK